MTQLPQSFAKDPVALNEQLIPYCEPMDASGCIRWTGPVSVYGVPFVTIGGAFMDVIKCFWWIRHGYKPRWAYMIPQCKTHGCLNTDHFIDQTPEEVRFKWLIRIQAPDWGRKSQAKMWGLYQEGMTMKQIAKQFKCHRCTIAKALRTYRQSLPPGEQLCFGKIPRGTLEEIHIKHLEGVSMVKLAERFGIPRSSLIRAYKRFALDVLIADLTG